MVSQLRTKYDIIINGGGIVGFSLLNLLLRSPHLGKAKFLLIEQANRPSSFRQPPRTISHDDSVKNPQDAKSFSNRVSSITLNSKRALKRVGVWDTAKPYAKDVRKIHVWNYDYNHKFDFRQDLPNSCDEKEDERNVMFSILENNRLSNALLENIIDMQGRGETIAWSSTLERLDESLDSGLVDAGIIDDKGVEHTISAALILGCDGYKSKVRELTKMQYKEYDLKKTAIVGTVKMSPQPTNRENNIAYQRFSPEKDSVAALLPLDTEFSSFVISAPSDYAAFLKDCDDDTFIQEFNRLLSADEVNKSPILRGIHEVTNATYDNLKALLQLVKPRLGLTDGIIDIGDGLDEKPSLDYVVQGSRATFPLIFGTTSPRMLTSLPGLDRLQIALLGDSSHRIHPLAGQGLNLGIQDAIELVKQLEFIAKSGEKIFSDTNLMSKALRRYEMRRQAFVMPVLASILAMQDLFKIAPTRMISSMNKCPPLKTISVRVANGC